MAKSGAASLHSTHNRMHTYTHAFYNRFFFSLLCAFANFLYMPPIKRKIGAILLWRITRKMNAQN